MKVFGRGAWSARLSVRKQIGPPPLNPHGTAVNPDPGQRDAVQFLARLPLPHHRFQGHIAPRPPATVRRLRRSTSETRCGYSAKRPCGDPSVETGSLSTGTGRQSHPLSPTTSSSVPAGISWSFTCSAQTHGFRAWRTNSCLLMLLTACTPCRTFFVDRYERGQPGIIVFRFGGCLNVACRCAAPAVLLGASERATTPLSAPKWIAPPCPPPTGIRRTRGPTNRWAAKRTSTSNPQNASPISHRQRFADVVSGSGPPVAVHR